MKKLSFFLMAMLFSVMSFATEVTVSIAEYATANGWVNSTAYNSLTMDEVVTVTANPTTGTYNNTGKYYDNGTNWRMYQNEAPAITVSAAEGYLLTSVTFTYESNKTGVMVDADGAQVASAEAYALDNVASATFSVSNTNPDVSNGQARITAITVVYEAAVVEPTTETVYFINNKGWSKVNAYAWNTTGNNSWPGKPATKEAEQIAGYDVYSFTADAGQYDNVIFNNGSGDQTADLVWTAGKYVVNNQWYTKEEAEAQLALPVEYESVYFVNAQGWAKVNIYTWTPEVGGWPGVAMTKEAEQLAGYDVYSYTVEKGTSFGGMLFNCGGDECKTGDLVWTAGKYYVKDGWYTKEEAEAKLAAPVVTTWTMVGQEELFTPAWTPTAVENDMEKQEDGSYVLILENKTLEAGEYEYKAVKNHDWTVSIPQEGNYVLSVETKGKYNIVFTVNAEATELIAEATYIEPEIEWIPMELEISNLTTSEIPVADQTVLQLMGRNDMMDSEVMLFLNNYTGEEKAYEVNAESSFVTYGGMELTVMDGSITKSVDPELGEVFAGIVHASVGEDGETMYVEFALTMYALPPIAIELEDVEIVVNEESAIAFFKATWEGSPLQVEVSGFEEVDFKEYPECWLSIGDDVAAAGPAAIIIEDGVAMLEGEFTSFATGKTYEVMLTGTLPVKEEPALKGVVKRAVQLGESVVVLTHEADGTAHIYNVVEGLAHEVSQEGVVAVDPENKGSYLAISDIALTEDGKLVANNYVRCQFAGTAPEDGYKLGTSYYYIWDDLTGAPRVWFTSQATARSSHGDMGKTFAVKGTSTDAKVLVTAVHNNNRAVRMALYSIIDGVYEEPDIAGGTYNNDYYFNFGLHTTANYYKEATQGKEFYLLASPLADASWIIEGELSEPSEFLVPAEIGADYAANQEIAAGTLGNKYQGTSIVTVDEKVLMVAPYADAEGKLVGVKVLDITAGLAAATEVATANLDAAVEATAAATAVAVAENTLTITLVADATIYTLNVELESEPEYWVIEDNITNLVIDLESMAIMGGPSTMWQVEVYLGLAEDDNLDGQWSLSPESSVAIMGLDARIIDGYVYDIDVNAPAAKAVLHVEDNGSFYEIKLDMTSTPQEAIVVVVEDATVQIDTVPMFGDVVEYALKMTANWTYAEDGVTYPVSVEVPVYYPEATEPSEMTCTVTIGGNGDTDPWLGFGEGTLTITTVDGVVTAKGIVANPYTGVAFDVTVSGKLPAAEPVKHTVTITVNPEGAGTVTGAGEYADGAEVTVTAEENEGYIFLGWMEDGEFVAEDYEYTFTILNDVDLVAVYATQLVGVAEDLVITETALTATAILSTGTTLTVNLVLGEYDEEQGAYWLAETTTLTLGDKALTLLDGLVMVNAEQQTAIAVVLAEHEGVFYAFTLMLAAPASGVDNINTNVAPRKVIRDGQLIIIKNGVEYNVQGAILK